MFSCQQTVALTFVHDQEWRSIHDVNSGYRMRHTPREYGDIPFGASVIFPLFIHSAAISAFYQPGQLSQDFRRKGSKRDWQRGHRSTSQPAHSYLPLSLILSFSIHLYRFILYLLTLPTQTLSIALSLSRTKQSTKTNKTTSIWQSEYESLITSENFNSTLSREHES